MTLVINKKDAKIYKQNQKGKLQQKPGKGNLASHFGELKRGLNGLQYQLTVRKNED